MADTVTLYREVVINLAEERRRIKTPRMFNEKQRKVLFKAVQLFEDGLIGELIDHVQSKESKNLFDYPVWEFLSDQFYDIVGAIGMGVVYKRKQTIIKEAMENM